MSDTKRNTGNEVRGWFSRGYLPHLDAPEVWQFVTFRLADALPKLVVDRWKRELEEEPETDRRLVRLVDRYLDEGHGSCLLGDPDSAVIVEGALLHFDGQRYDLAAWVVMPNHVHVLVRPREGWTLGELIGSWKRFSATRINRMSGGNGRLWQVAYFDRFIRDREHMNRTVAYIHENPVRAGLVTAAEEWDFSSARA